MVGIGESYIPAFVLALGMGEVASGLIATVPLLAGGFLQLVAPLGVRLTGSHRRWAVLCASLQAGAFVPLIAGAVAGRMPFFLVFLVAALYLGSGMARFVSAAMLRSQMEPDLPAMPYKAGEVFGMIRRLPRSPGGTLLVYMLVLTVTVTIASPFFTAFMLRKLGMSYSAYMSLMAIALATRVIVLPPLGRLARRTARRRLRPHLFCRKGKMHLDDHPLAVTPL